MAFRRSGQLAAKVLLPGLSAEVERGVSRQPERILRKAGSVGLSQICLPSPLQKAIKAALEDSPSPKLRRDVAKLSEILRARSNGWPIAAASSDSDSESQVADSTQPESNSSPGSWDETGRLLSRLLKPGKGPPPEYHEAAAAAYMAARMPSSYAATLRVLLEEEVSEAAGSGAGRQLKTRLPDFQPSSILDFGTGPGTAIWAVQGAWPHSSQRVVAVESAPAMIQLCSQLMQGQLKMPRLQHFTTLDTASRMLRGEDRHFDLVIAAYSLGEVEDEEFKNVVRRLWSHTRDLLVLVETGNPRGWELVAQARAQVLQQELRALRKKGPDMVNKPGDPPLGAHVVAPCAHDGRCPMDGTKSWCHFVQRLQRSEVQRLAKKAAGQTISYNYEDEKFSFVVLRRGDRPVKPSPLANLEELEARTKDAKAIQQEVRAKHNTYMLHLHEALRLKPKNKTAETETDGTVEVVTESVKEGSSTEDVWRATGEDGQDKVEEWAEAASANGSMEVPFQQASTASSDGNAVRKGAESAITEENSQMREVGEGADLGEGDEDEEEDEGEGGREEGEDMDDDGEGDEDEEHMIAEVNSGWARIVRAPRRRGAHVLLDICCATSEDGKRGELQRHIITHRSRKLEYRYARNARWGDLWPL